MSEKDFWNNSKIAILGAGSWGTVLANLVAPHCREVRIFAHNEDRARAMNSTRTNEKYLPEYKLHERIIAMHELERVLEGGVDAMIWALPSDTYRAITRKIAPLLTGREIIFHATKGVEEGTLKRMSQILNEELPCPRIGVISGPNLAKEIVRGDPSATVIASYFEEVILAGKFLLNGPLFRVYSSKDVVGVEWAGTIKNVLAIASGALDARKFGWNTRALLLNRGLLEMIRFGLAMGAKESTFLGLAGLGDLQATCSSSLSRNYRVGYMLAQGEKIKTVLQSLGGIAEGIRTTFSVKAFADSKKIQMPITEGVYKLLHSELDLNTGIQILIQPKNDSDWNIDL